MRRGDHGWAIAISDNRHFDIVPAHIEALCSPYSDESLNRVFMDRGEAIDEVIRNMERERAALNRQLARAKRMRARLRRRERLL